MRRAAAILCALAALASAAGALAATHAASLERTLRRDIAPAGGGSGAEVVDATADQPLFGSRARTPRILASNTKLFTSAAVLARVGPAASLATTVLGTGTLSADGVWQGNIYLRGGGDPTFGSRAFAASAYGTHASVEALAGELAAAGIRRISGRVVGDESLFDSRRGGPASGYASSIYVGPLSALSYDRGLANSAGTAWQTNPPAFAAAKLRAALRRAGIGVGHGSQAGRTPSGAVELVEVRSAPIARLLQIMDTDSDNFFAEMLAKGLAADGRPGGPLRQAGDPLPPPPTPGAPPPAAVTLPPPGIGTTAAGAQASRTYAHTLGIRASLVDGSGLSYSDRASPSQVVTLLSALRSLPYFQAFYNALAIAGRDGTLVDRLRSGPAYRHCHGKTGTLPSVGATALSGYCRTPQHHTLVFSILMNGVDVAAGEALQDSMAEAVAGY